MTITQRPTFIAYVVSGDGKPAHWTEIGAAWPHKSGEGLSIKLTAFPVNGRIELVTAKSSQPDEVGRKS